MTGRTASRHQLEAEGRALDVARKRFVSWRRDWHDAGIAMDPDTLAKLRKAARAFHRAVEQLLDGDGTSMTTARVLVRMQQLELHQHPQDHYRTQLVDAMVTALKVDTALAMDVRRGNRAHELTHAWIMTAADAWREAFGDVVEARLASALASYHRLEVPRVDGIKQVRAALARRKAHLQTAIGDIQN